MIKFFYFAITLCCLAGTTGCTALSQATTSRAAVVSGIGGYYGYNVLGVVSSESEASELAAKRGYSNYMYDSVTGIAYGK